ncbi:MAG: uracil phosphoribosyltransferase [Planctomycetes bacterium]|nr:uracil phosphoribosyltransferase [Planctomycetota bacterium]MCP4770655.1 uracil phosphoribosyltransferase [Planctomycetota bacterium]MCP4860280.1 uracil phosphoribosyltransferase [Planctomycetota bacterium]
MPSITLDHPIVASLLTRLREQSTSSAEFRLITRQLTLFLAVEATRDLPTNAVEIETPLCVTQGQALSTSMAIVPILRAGLGMSETMSELLPEASIRHIGLYRDEETLQPISYYQKLPASNPPQIALVVDPMLATGGTAVAVITELKAWGVADIRFLGILGAPEGVQALQAAHPDVRILLAGLDEKLNDKGYILPGLGDAGDRQYNTN